MTEPAEPTRLRRTWLRGYRTSDVEIALARSGLSLERLEHELGAARGRVQAMQAEINELHGRIDGFRRREGELDRALDDVRHQREALDREARTRAEAILADAEGHAASLRTEALKQVGALQEQVEQLLAVRSGLMTALRKAGDGIGRALEQVDAPPPDARPADELADRLSRWTRDATD